MAYKVIDVASHEWFLPKEYPRPEQYGPLRQYDKAMSCMSGTKKYRCGSQTFFKVNGVPRCMIHALRELNEMLYTPEERNGNGD
jgi:hypothetical protein